MENKFFTFIKPYLNYIDNGHLYRKPFSWLYVLLAIINLIAPLYVFYMAVDNNIFESPAKFIISFLTVNFSPKIEVQRQKADNMAWQPSKWPKCTCSPESTQNGVKWSPTIRN